MYSVQCIPLFHLRYYLPIWSLIYYCQFFSGKFSFYWTNIEASFCGSVWLSFSNLEVVGSGPRSGCHKISSRSATCGEMQNLVSHNPEICHKFLSKYSGAVYVVYTSRKRCWVSNLWQKFPPVKRLCHRFYTVGPSCWVV